MKHLCYTCLLGILGLLFIPHSLWAETWAETFRFRHFQIADGLASNTVRAIAQDRYGFIWFGTDDGLNRYDGIEIKSYRTYPTDVQEFISTLYAADDCLWIGTGRASSAMIPNSGNCNTIRWRRPTALRRVPTWTRRIRSGCWLVCRLSPSTGRTRLRDSSNPLCNAISAEIRTKGRKPCG